MSLRLGLTKQDNRVTVNSQTTAFISWFMIGFVLFEGTDVLNRYL